MSGNNKAWDQFETNERKFGLKTDYNENIYTTEINKNHPEYEKRMSYADKKMREIQATAAFNPHVAEERIMDYVGGDNRDEEDKYVSIPCSSWVVGANYEIDTVGFAGNNRSRISPL